MSPAMMPVISMPTDALYEAASVLEKKVDVSTDSLTVFQGHHPEHGLVTVVIPPFSEGLLIKSVSASD